MILHSFASRPKGFFKNVIKIKPPMCFSKQDADFMLFELDRALSIATKKAATASL